MHLEGPWLSTTGKRKGKIKFRNAEEARKYRENEQAWQDMLKRHGVEQEELKRKRAMTGDVYVPPKLNYRGAGQPKLKSLDTGIGTATKKDSPVYTGNKIVGIGTMHKSNAVPIFSDIEAKEISSMRR